MAEYEDIIKKIPVPERALGPLAGLATRLDYLGPKVQKLEGELSPQVADLAEKVGKLEYALRTLELPEGVMPQKIEQIPFVYDLEKAGVEGSQVMLSEHAPFSGYIKAVSIHWPEGCNHLVEIRAGHSTKQFCPVEGYLALNDVTPTYPFNEWVHDNEEIWMEMKNGDSDNTHAITALIQLVG
ncbi:unnamed protein product, partial [marine sediment metagenome]